MGFLMETTVRWVRRSVPDVPIVSTDAVAAMDRVALLDVRTEEEVAVSSIPGAVQVDPEEAVAEEVAGKTIEEWNRSGTTVVCFCSVGYRSARMVKRLQEAGMLRVANMEGSLFKWANEGKPLTGDKVHPYNAAFGLLLNKELRGP